MASSEPETVIGYDEMPGLINPKRGYVVSANNRLAPNDYAGRDRAALYDVVLEQLDAKVRSILESGKIEAEKRRQISLRTPR